MGIRTPGLLIAKEKYGITTGLDEEGRTATKRDETLCWTGFRHGLKATNCDKLRRGQKPRTYTPGIYTIYTHFRLWRVMGLKDYVSVPLNFKRRPEVRMLALRLGRGSAPEEFERMMRQRGMAEEECADIYAFVESRWVITAWRPPRS